MHITCNKCGCVIDLRAKHLCLGTFKISAQVEASKGEGIAVGEKSQALESSEAETPSRINCPDCNNPLSISKEGIADWCHCCQGYRRQFVSASKPKEEWGRSK